jgi:hypothetical protein
MELGREQKWSIKSSAVYGCLIGFALTAIHHIQHALSNDIPEDICAHDLDKMIVGASGGAILLPSMQFSEIGSRGGAR